MSEDVIDSVFSQLKKYIDEGRRIDSLYLFGGEPLLRTNRKIVEYICSNARKLGIPISCISNGYDLDEYIDLILDYNFQTVQITIDGTKETHDSRRFLTGGQGTFDRILKNVDLALKKGGVNRAPHEC
ncbi:MAG: radical SAM protein [Eubacteriales bacterium]|nr:radical SAM protein [Eubacteriales bacterium]